jgi:ParB family chromosome partitioning protein
MVIDEMISTGHARCLISIDDKELQHQIALKIFDEKLSVREAEKLVKKLLQTKDEKPKEEKNETLDSICRNIADQMKQILGTKVEIHQKNKDKGKIEIEYYSTDELNRLLELIQTIQKD